MNKYLTKYLKELEIITKTKRLKNKEDVLETLLTKISFFQHERLVHLIVTMFTGLFTILAFMLAIISSHFELLIVALILTCLFIPYIFHYFFLENSVQKLYNYYEKIKSIK